MKCSLSCAQPNCTVYSPQGPRLIPSILIFSTACVLYWLTHVCLDICSKERGIWDLLLWEFLCNGRIVSFQLIARSVPVMQDTKTCPPGCSHTNVVIVWPVLLSDVGATVEVFVLILVVRMECGSTMASPKKRVRCIC